MDTGISKSELLKRFEVLKFMEEMSLNEDVLNEEIYKQIVNDSLWIDACIKAMSESDDPIGVFKRMLDEKVKSVIERYLSVMVEAESQLVEGIPMH